MRIFARCNDLNSNDQLVIKNCCFDKRRGLVIIMVDGDLMDKRNKLKTTRHDKKIFISASILFSEADQIFHENQKWYKNTCKFSTRGKMY